MMKDVDAGKPITRGDRQDKKLYVLYKQFHTKQSIGVKIGSIRLGFEIEEQCGRESRARQGEWIPCS